LPADHPVDYKAERVRPSSVVGDGNAYNFGESATSVEGLQSTRFCRW